MIETPILFFGENVVCRCDGKCHKAWGINNRPRIHLSDDEDDYIYIADDELGDAPLNPGTYEGGHGKPRGPKEHNKWCVRECERSALDEDPPDLNNPRKNIP